MKKCIYYILVVLVSFIPLILQANTGSSPIAQFEFEKSSYQISEPIGVRESSYSTSGEKIVQREWMVVVEGKRKTSPNVTSLLKGVKPGNFEVFLRVKDAKGTWSAWTSRKVTLMAIKPIKITSFTSEQVQYDIGEKLQLDWVYDNPNDLLIKGQRWRYRNLATGGSLVYGKPEYFKQAGTYEISLEVQDEWGNWSNKALCKVTVTSNQVVRDGYYLFKKGRQGDLLEGYIDQDYNTFDLIEKIEVEDTPGTLIVSNSPETIASSGVLYKDTAEGKGRVVVHHLNSTSVSKKLMILATVTGSSPVQLTVQNQAIKGPHRNILKMGQMATYDYFKGQATKSYTLKPGVTTTLYDSSTIKSWKKDEVISGMLDFESNGPVTFTVVCMDQGSPIENISKLNNLAKDVHIRGTFNVLERTYHIQIDELSQPGKVVIGGSEEEWLVGKDALTGEIVKNRGNYGLPVQMKLMTKEDMGIILNARGGGYLGAIKWNKSKVFNVPNEEVLSDKKLAALIGMVSKGTMTEWTYMLPNGSAAPVLFGFIPEHLWRK